MREQLISRIRLGVIFIMLLSFIAMVLLAQNENFPYRDQIVRDSQRIATLEHALESLQSGGSTAANVLAIKVGILESRLESTQRELADLRRILYGSLTFAVLQGIGLAVFGIKAWFNWVNKQANRDRNADG